MNPKFSVFLVACPKDYLKLPIFLEHLLANIEGYDDIHLCTPAEIPAKYYDPIAKYPINFHHDLNVLPCTPRRWKYRPNWVYQQFIKLLQNVTKNDWYFVIDCDVLLLNPLPLWADDGRPITRWAWPQNNRPYYAFSEEMFGFGRVVDHTWLADSGFYNKKYCQEMILSRHRSVKDFLKRSYGVINCNVYPSEADLYMGYMTVNHPDAYDVRRLDLKAVGEWSKDAFTPLWSEDQIRNEIKIAKTEGREGVAVHSWVDKSHNLWR